MSIEPEREALATRLAQAAIDMSMGSVHSFDSVHKVLLRATVFWDRMVKAEKDLEDLKVRLVAEVESSRPVQDGEPYRSGMNAGIDRAIFRIKEFPATPSAEETP